VSHGSGSLMRASVKSLGLSRRYGYRSYYPPTATAIRLTTADRSLITAPTTHREVITATTLINRRAPSVGKPSSF
jgi:hypothetical protein